MKREIKNPYKQLEEKNRQLEEEYKTLLKKKKKTLKDNKKIDIDHIQRLAKGISIPRYILDFESKTLENLPFYKFTKEITKWKKRLNEDCLLSPYLKHNLETWLLLEEYRAYLWLLLKFHPLQFIKKKFDIRDHEFRILQSLGYRECLKAIGKKMADGPMIADPEKLCNGKIETQIAREIKGKISSKLDYLKCYQNIKSVLRTKRNTRGWPLFTQYLIPLLYEYLYEFFKRPSKKRNWSDETKRPTTRRAKYPRDLINLIKDILRYEYPQWCKKLNNNDIVSDISRYKNNYSRRKFIKSLLAERLPTFSSN